MKYLILAFMCCGGCLSLSAQECADNHDHQHGMNEIGMSVGPSYSFDHKDWRASAHLHYFRLLKPHSKWALGLGVESAFGKGSHYNLSAGARYTPFRFVELSFLPGVNFVKEEHEEHGGHEEHEEKTKASFALHGEVVVNLLELNNFHLGPVLDYSWSKGHTHLMLGVHAAYSF